MNRPTRNTLVGMVLCLIVAAVYSCKAKAADTTVRDDLINRYKKCVLEDAFVSMTPSNKMKAERAFIACDTEEQAIRSWMQLAAVPQDVAQALVVRIKLDLKKTIAP